MLELRLEDYDVIRAAVSSRQPQNSNPSKNIVAIGEDFSESHKVSVKLRPKQ